VAKVVTSIKAALNRRVDLEDYLVWSTIVAALLLVPLFRDAFHAGYIIVVLNSLILLASDRLNIHRNHALALIALTVFSVVGARLSGTPLTAPASQILGISVLSIYFFSALTNLKLSLHQWMERYMRVAFGLAVFALITWPAISFVTGDVRLRGIYTEPSFYINATMPAMGYCLNRFIQERRYGRETLVFLLTYILADSSLGFLGLMLTALLSYAPRLKGWQLLAGVALLTGLMGGLYVGSGNFRLRANDTIAAIATQDLSGSNASTFALLSNFYVTSQSFLNHPLTGIGIGGFAHAYDKYIGEITGGDLSEVASMQLNRDDGNSMFLRVATELGVPGLVVLFAFLIVCALVKEYPYQLIRNAILPYLLIRMGRGGHYFTVELYFFVGIYLLNYMQSRAAQKTGQCTEFRSQWSAV
jgi:hypothetical protein